MRVLVTDSDTRSALAVVRSLGRAGHEVITSGVSAQSLAAASRFSSAFEAYPDPGQNADAFVSWLLGVVRSRGIEVLIPTTEITTLLVTQHAQELPSSCRVPFPEAAAVSTASDKAKMVALAKELGVPVPLSIAVHSAEEGLRYAGDLPFPIVVKPGRSRVRVGRSWVSTSVRYADNAPTLERLLRAIPEGAYPVLLQERINGPGAGVFACFDNGKPIGLFAHRRLREKPPSGGVSVLCESAPLEPTAAEHATRLLSHLGWRGVAMVEFKKDLRDGSFRLMEINARFWGSLELSIASGVNFPLMLVDIAAGKPLPAPGAYRLGVRSRWLGGDLDSLLLSLTRSREQLNLPPGHPGRAKTLASFLKFWGAHYEIEQLDDLGPARREWARRLGLSSGQAPQAAPAA